MARMRSSKTLGGAGESGVVRLPPDLTARVDAEARRMESDRPGSIISRASENLEVLTIKHKSLNDLVSEVDRAAEDAIIDVIKGKLS